VGSYSCWFSSAAAVVVVVKRVNQTTRNQVIISIRPQQPILLLTSVVWYKHFNFSERSHQIRHQQEVRLQVDEDESRRNDSERTALPSAPPPVVRTESELREDARAEHRRRLDAILATQASAANRDHAGSGYDYSSHVNYMSHSERPRAPRESNVLSRPRQHREAQTTPGIPVIPSTAHGEAQTTPAGGSQTDLHDRDAISSDEYRIPYGYDHPDNIVTGFRRIQMAKKEGKMDPKSTALNRLGGTYTPPEDF